MASPVLPRRRGAALLIAAITLGPGGAGGAETSSVALSLFEPAGHRCRWSRVEATSGQRRPVATFPGSCRGARARFPPAADRALIWFDPSLAALQVTPSGIERRTPAATGRPAAARLFFVRLSGGRPTPLPLPPRGQLTELGFSPPGDAWALTLAPCPTVKAAGCGTEPGPGDGLPGVARAYRLAGSRWRLVESRATRQGADRSPGVKVLEQAARLAPPSPGGLAVRPPGRPVADPARLARLRAFAPHLVPGEQQRWLALTTAVGELFVWQTAVEELFSTGAIALGAGGELIPPPGLGLGPQDIVALATEGDYLLVATFGDGGRPRLYHLGQGGLSLSSDDGQGASFWPRGAAATIAPTPR